MTADLLKAFAQLSDRRFRRVVLFSCLLAALLLALLAAGAGWALGGLTGIGWLDIAAGLAGGIAAFAAAAMLFPAAAAALQGLFLESAVRAVEARHYPNLGAPNAQGGGETLRQTLFFVGAALGLNLLLLSVFTIIDGLVFTVFDGLWVRRREELAGCREAVGASSRCAAPPLRYGPSGDPPPSTRRSAAMAVSKLPATGRSLTAVLRWGD